MRGRNVCSWKITLGTLTRFYAPSREPGSSKDDARYVGFVALIENTGTRYSARKRKCRRKWGIIANAETARYIPYYSSRSQNSWEDVCRAKRMCAANEALSPYCETYVSSTSNHNEAPNYAENFARDLRLLFPLLRPSFFFVGKQSQLNFNRRMDSYVSYKTTRNVF